MVITFKRPKVAVQVFQNIHIYQHSNFGIAKTQVRRSGWPHKITSSTGFVTENVVKLPDTIYFEADFTPSHLIILNDACPGSSEWQLRHWHCFQRRALKKFEIFKIHTEGEICELYLGKTSHFLEMGIPHSANLKIGEIQTGTSLRICVNGKHNNNLSSRRNTTYIEYDYIFNHLGVFESFDICEPADLTITKEIPFKQFKTIDLRKVLS